MFSIFISILLLFKVGWLLGLVACSLSVAAQKYLRA